MTDPIFGELEKKDDYWLGRQNIEFGGKTYTVKIEISSGYGEEERITIKQKNAFKCFIEKWPKLQAKLIVALIEYYNAEERFSWGPDDEEELAEWWPEIETKKALLQAVTIETIVIKADFLMKNNRCIYLLFSRTWGGEDFDDNGIAVRYINEEIDKIGYKDMAY